MVIPFYAITTKKEQVFTELQSFLSRTAYRGSFIDNNKGNNLLFKRLIMNSEFREDSTPSIVRDEVNDEFEILLSCVGMDLFVLPL